METAESSLVLSAALWYAKHGYYVFPIYEPNAEGGCSCGDPECSHPAKHPRSTHGHLDATLDERQIRHWWTVWPYANVGIACGPSNIYVLDHDVRSGGFALRADLIEFFTKNYGPLPDTCTVRTGSSDGSSHDIFYHPWAEGDTVPKDFDKPHGLELRGNGNYIVAAPSRHYTGGTYSVDGMGGGNAFLKLAPAPPSMVLRINSNGHSRPAAEESRHKWNEGVRNESLFRLACSLRGRGMTVETITTILLTANEAHCEPPLKESEVRQIAKSAAKYEPGASAYVSFDEEPSQTKTSDEWLEPPEPQSLGGELPPVDEFNELLLPESFRAHVVDVSQRMQVPVDLPAAFSMICLGGAVNRRAFIQPKARDDGWQVVMNLWGGLIANPGFLKSPVMQAIAQPLRQIQNQYRLTYESELADFAGEKEAADLRHDAWKQQYKEATRKGTTPPIRPDNTLVAPKRKRLIVNDATFEAVHQILTENQAGVLTLRDELTGWWSQLDRQGREGERGFYLESWNGDTQRDVDRIERGYVPLGACCLSMGGGIQPARLRSYLSDALKDNPNNDGLLQRFQVLVWPDAPRQWTYVDCRPDDIAIAQTRYVFEKLTALEPEMPVRLRFAPDAQELFVAWLTELEDKVRGNTLHPALTSHLSKYRSLMPTLAGLCALADAVGRGEEIELVQLPYAQRGAAWCAYLESHARRVYSCIVSPPVKAARDLGEKIKQRQLGADGFFTLRDVYRPGWAGLDDPEMAKKAVAVLEDAAWVRDVSGKSGAGGGRPSFRYQINPRLFS